MGLRSARLIAWSFAALVVLISALVLLIFGSNAPMPQHFGSDGSVIDWEPAGQMVITLASQTLLICGAHDLLLTQPHRWRRNLIRAGSVFALSWIGSTGLVLMMMLMMVATMLEHRAPVAAILSAMIGVLMVVKANHLPKTRPAWRNGLIFPHLASRPEVWRRVHRVAAPRTLAIGLALVATALLAPADFAFTRLIVAALVADMVLTLVHALWLNRQFYRPDSAERDGGRR